MFDLSTSLAKGKEIHISAFDFKFLQFHCFLPFKSIIKTGNFFFKIWNYKGLFLIFYLLINKAHYNNISQNILESPVLWTLSDFCFTPKTFLRLLDLDKCANTELFIIKSVFNFVKHLKFLFTEKCFSGEQQ